MAGHTPEPSARAQPPSDEHRTPDWARLILKNICLALAYSLTGTLAMFLARGTVFASPVWPAAGIAFALVFVRGMAYLPGVLLGSLVTKLPSLLHIGPGLSINLANAVSISIGTTLSILTGTLLVRRVVGRHPRLIDARQILLFLVLAGPITGAISASIHTIILMMSGTLASSGAILAWFTWWVGSTLGIVVFAPITMMFLPEQADIWQARRWKIIVPSIVTLCLVLFTVLQNANITANQRSTFIGQQASDALQSVDRTLTTHKDMLSAIVSMQNASKGVSQQEFAIFTRSFLERHRGLQAISWNPLIKADQRSTYEARQRAQPALANFRILERNAAGELVPAGERPEYVPVGYIEPIATNAAALGFDVYSNPLRAEAIDRARRLNKIQASAPIQLVQDNDQHKSVLMFLASRNSAGEIDGFSAGVYRMDDLLFASIRDIKWEFWNFLLSDTTDPAHPIPMAERLVDGSVLQSEQASLSAVTRAIDMGGRTWTLQAWPSEALLATLPPTTPVMLLTGMLTIAFLLEAFLLLVTGLERRWKSHAEDSSYNAHHDELTGLLNRRGLFNQLQGIQEAREQLRTTVASEFTHVLMFLDLDGFKQVNDVAGHGAGDAILRKVAEALHSATRQGDCIARIGGDEFVILAWDCTLENGLQIASAIRHAITAASIEWDGVPYSVGVSIGVSEIVATSSMSIDELLRQADAACYAAKHAGRDTVRVCAPSPASALVST